MYKILSIGTSFNHGLGLHFYERHTKGLPLNYTLRPEERELNVYNAFHSILARKLNVQSEILNDNKFGLDTKFDDLIYGIKLEVEKEQEIPIKIVVIQLSTAEKDFFIYKDTIYRLDFNSAEELIVSKDKLINSVSDDIKEDFTKELELELNEYLTDTEKWREKHAIWFVNKLNELNKFLKVISYYRYYNQLRNMFDKNLFVKLLANNQYFNDIQSMCDTNKLRIRDDIGGIDEHPNFEGHQVVADSLYESIIKHPLYQSI
jgi:sulfur relay (sulfurtransferase) DsrC/TusE family protein